MKQILLVVTSMVILAGCQTQQATVPTSSDAEPGTAARVGDTTLTGKIMQTGDKFSLIDSKGTQTELDGFKIDFTAYNGKLVSVTGQFSGDTLFVAKVEEAQ